MGPASLYTTVLWINTFLWLIVSAQVSLKFQSSHQLTTANAVRIKRQTSAEEWIENILHRMIKLEDDVAVATSQISGKADVANTQTALDGLQGNFKALGFYEDFNTENNPKSKNPCGSNSQIILGQNEMPWTAFGSSSCVKLMSGLFTFSNTTAICEQQFRIGEDISQPQVVSVDSSEQARDLLHILRRQTGLSYVWVDRKTASHVGTVGLNCTELSVGGQNTSVEWRSVECGRLSRVVCQKPVVVPYVKMARNQLEGKERVDELEKQLQRANVDILDLRRELKSMMDSFRVELVSQMEIKSTATESDLTELRRQKEELRTRLGQLRKELKEERRLRTAEVAQVVAKEELTSVNLSRVESEVASLEISGRRRDEQMDEMTRKAESDKRELREEMKSLLDSFRGKLVAQVKNKFTANEAELREVRRKNEELGDRVEALEVKLEELQIAMDEDKTLRNVKEAEMRGLIKSVESETSLQVSHLEESSTSRQSATEKEAAGIKRRLHEIAIIGDGVRSILTRVDSEVKMLQVWKRETDWHLESFGTDLSGLEERLGQLRSSNEESMHKLQVDLLNVGVWELGGPKRFDLSKAMGVWKRIEGFLRSSKFRSEWKCLEDTFSLTGNNLIHYKHHGRWMRSNEKATDPGVTPVDPESPHHWTKGAHNLWLKTDYDTWAITMRCTSQSISSCRELYILSRKTTLPSATLEMLRDAAEVNGFARANGFLYQPNC